MDSPRFMFPHRAFPGIVTRRETASLPHLLFADFHGDGGLRRAVDFYWNAKRITLATSGYGRTFKYVDPPNWYAETVSWAWGKTYRQYAADANQISLFPAGSELEPLMHPPMTRIEAFVGREYASDPVRASASLMRAGFWDSSSTRETELWMGFDAGEIVWSLTHNRYALLVQPEANFEGTDTTYGYWDPQSIMVAALLQPTGYVPGEGEGGIGTLTLPGWLENPCPFIVSGTACWNPVSECYEYPACAVTLEISVEFWTYT